MLQNLFSPLHKHATDAQVKVSKASTAMQTLVNEVSSPPASATETESTVQEIIQQLQQAIKRIMTQDGQNQEINLYLSQILIVLFNYTYIDYLKIQNKNSINSI